MLMEEKFRYLHGLSLREAFGKIEAGCLEAFIAANVCVLETSPTKRDAWASQLHPFTPLAGCRVLDLICSSHWGQHLQAQQK